jgi:hypothetical protein
MSATLSTFHGIFLCDRLLRFWSNFQQKPNASPPCGIGTAAYHSGNKILAILATKFEVLAPKLRGKE